MPPPIITPPPSRIETPETTATERYNKEPAYFKAALQTTRLSKNKEDVLIQEVTVWSF